MSYLSPYRNTSLQMRASSSSSSSSRQQQHQHHRQHHLQPLPNEDEIDIAAGYDGMLQELSTQRGRRGRSHTSSSSNSGDDHHDRRGDGVDSPGSSGGRGGSGSSSDDESSRDLHMHGHARFTSAAVAPAPSASAAVPRSSPNVSDYLSFDVHKLSQALNSAATTSAAAAASGGRKIAANTAATHYTPSPASAAAAATATHGSTNNHASYQAASSAVVSTNTRDADAGSFRHREYLLGATDYVRSLLEALGRVDDAVEREGILDVKVTQSNSLTNVRLRSAPESSLESGMLDASLQDMAKLTQSLLVKLAKAQATAQAAYQDQLVKMRAACNQSIRNALQADRAQTSAAIVRHRGEAQAAKEASLEQLRREVAERDAVISSLRDEITSLHNAAAQREDEVDAERSNFRLQLREVEDDHKLALQLKADEYRSDRAALEDRARGDVTEVKRECAAQIDALMDQHRLHMDSQSKHEAELRLLLTAEIERLAGEAAAARAETSAAADRAQAEREALQRQFSEERASMEREYQRTQADNVQALAGLRADVAERIRKIKEDERQRQAALAEAVGRERDGLVRTHAAETEALRERHRAEMKKLQANLDAKYSEQIASLRRAHDQEVRRLMADNDRLHRSLLVKARVAGAGIANTSSSSGSSNNAYSTTSPSRITSPSAYNAYNTTTTSTSPNGMLSELRDDLDSSSRGRYYSSNSTSTNGMSIEGGIDSNNSDEIISSIDRYTNPRNATTSSSTYSSNANTNTTSSGNYYDDSGYAAARAGKRQAYFDSINSINNSKAYDTINRNTDNNATSTSANSSTTTMRGRSQSPPPPPSSNSTSNMYSARTSAATPTRYNTSTTTTTTIGNTINSTSNATTSPGRRGVNWGVLQDSLDWQDGRSPSHGSPQQQHRGILKATSPSPNSYNNNTYPSTSTTTTTATVATQGSPPDTLMLDAALLNSRRPGGVANVSANAEAVGSYMDKLQNYLETATEVPSPVMRRLLDGGNGDDIDGNQYFDNDEEE